MNPSNSRLPLLMGAPAYHDSRSLRRNGHAGERSIAARCIRAAFEPVVVELVDDGIDPWVQRVDPLDGR